MSFLITNPLSMRGYEMTGQDINSYFLKLAGNDAIKNGLKVNYIRGDMRTIGFKGYFDAVLSLFTSIGVLESDEEDEKVFKAVNAALKPGGKFLIDYINRDFIMRRYQADDIRTIPGGFVKIKRVHDHIKCSHREVYDIYRNKKHLKHIEINFRFYTVTELTSMLHRSGFRVCSIFGGYEDTPLSFDTKSCFIIAEKTN